MIYLDYNASHPPFEDIMKSNLEEYFLNFANPSGISRAGQQAQRRIEQSREKIQNLFNKTPVFCSTGTEATWLLVNSFISKEDTVLVSPYEHEAMQSALRNSGAKIIRLSADKTGRVHPDEVRERILQSNVTVVVMIAVSNESGVIQPVEETAEIIAESGKKILFLSDTIQAACKTRISFSHFDACLINGIKTGGGPGAAALLVNDTENVKPVFSGGLQEFEKRAGTENPAAIASLADSAVRLSENYDNLMQVTGYAQKKLEEAVRQNVGIIIGESSPRLTNTTYALFTHLQNMDFTLIALDQEEVVCSTGSSCKSRTRQPSQTLLSMGYREEEALTALRFSTGLFTTKEEIDIFTEKLPSILEAGR